MTKVKNKQKKKLNLEVPEEIRILFGKFYFFSLLYIIFFGIIYPFFLLERISIVSSVMIFICLIMIYLYIINDVRSNKKNFYSNMYFYLMVIVFFVISFSLIRFIVSLEI